jgi:hypothetical protein
MDHDDFDHDDEYGPEEGGVQEFIDFFGEPSRRLRGLFAYPCDTQGDVVTCL